MKKTASLLLFSALLCMACNDSKRDAIGSTEVLIETSEGDIVVRLYDDTPLHRDHFIKNVEAGVYDGLLFNRIVPDMVIQTGDTTLHAQTGGKARKADGSRASLASTTGTADSAANSRAVRPGDGIAPEIIYPRHFHKQGALAAAREPDSINPGRYSSPLQWYIVTGKKQTSAELSELQALLYEGKVVALFEGLQRQHADELEQLRTTNRAAWQELLNHLQVEAEETIAANPPKPFNDIQRQTYTRIGGAPHLDGEYTVFGEVVDGMPIALRIGRTPVDAKERPRRQVYVKRITIR
ncbi:MAG: peptidylprolyl isomerase [Bacteroidales bacterium]|nr:peptidylprolyl isomerase [Bacteroidales bacterium]